MFFPICETNFKVEPFSTLQHLSTKNDEYKIEILTKKAGEIHMMPCHMNTAPRTVFVECLPDYSKDFASDTPQAERIF